MGEIPADEEMTYRDLLYQRLVERLQDRRVEDTPEGKAAIVALATQAMDELIRECDFMLTKMDVAFDPDTGKLDINMTIPIMVRVQNEEHEEDN